MQAYILRRLLFIVPTLFGILLLNFIIVQWAPGGPVEKAMLTLKGEHVGATARITGATTDFSLLKSAQSSQVYRGSQGIDPEIIKELEKMYGFDKPAPERFLKMVGDYLSFNFGESFYRDATVLELILEKMPVSISLGFWTTLLIYCISIPLGIAKAVHDGSRFDVWSSAVVVIGNAIPGFLFAILLIILFAGGSYFTWFPLRGLTSPHWEELDMLGKILDYFWHLVLPVAALVISGFAVLTMLTKNSFIEEIGKQYVVTAKAKGLTPRKVLYGHVFRNAMLIIVAGFPGAILGIFFTGSLLIEVIFSLDGLGRLGFESVINRDYPVVFGTLYLFTLLGLVFRLLGDLVYVWVDPRIDFEKRG